MKENPFDRIMDKSFQRVEKVSNHIAGSFKNVKPFQKTVITSEELYQSYVVLNDQDIQYLVGKYGENMVTEYFQEMEGIGKKGVM